MSIGSPTFKDVEDAQNKTAILHDIIAERERQDTKWGVQTNTPEVWLTILAEEVGEAAQEVLTKRVGEAGNGHGDIREELIQAAAVLVAWVEQIDREERV
jgi:NTP pyrophosphatase (non-canonical NTP hydrolase)